MFFNRKDNPDPAQADIEEVPLSQFDAVAFVAEKIQETNKLRYGIERVWYRNILFYIGKQWIRYDDKKRTWVRPNLPEWMPTPVTNRFASCCDIIASVLQQVKPEIVFSPASPDDRNVQTAKKANLVNDICAEESGFADQEGRFNAWLTLTGNAFLRPWYDMDPKHGMTQLPQYGCTAPQCGYVGSAADFGENGEIKCPQCGGAEAMPTGAMEEVPRGKLVTDVLSPFEVYADLSVERLENQPYVMICGTLPLSVIKQRWGEKAKDIKAQGTSPQLGQFYFQSLSYITNTTDTGFGSGTEYAGGVQSEKATVWELFVPVSRQLPLGYHGYICDKIELEGGPLEYHDPKGLGFVNLIHVKAMDTPKRFFCKALVDDLVHKQIQRNKLEAFIQLALQRTANPVWLLPNACGVENLTGEPGEIVRYNDSNTAMAKPERVGGVELTQSVFRWLEKIDKDFEELASTYDILKGSMPSNVPTLGGLELLKERALSRFTPTIRSIERARVRLSYMWLWIFKEYAGDARQRVTRDPNGKWMSECFKGSDLTGDVDIKAEPGSSAPRSAAYRQFISGQLLDKGLLDMNDPFTRLEVLRTYNADSFARTLSEDVQDASREEGRFLLGTAPVLRPDIDNHQIHIASHIRFAKTDEFRDLDPQGQEVFMAHLLEHKRFFVIQLQNMQVMQSPPPPTAGPQGPVPAGVGSSVGGQP